MFDENIFIVIALQIFLFVVLPIAAIWLLGV